MFYEPSKGHGLPHDPFKAIVAPRPVGWISTRASDSSLNLAPYSFFNALGGHPPLVYFASESRKHSAQFAEEGGDFVANLVGRDLLDRMVASSVDAPTGVSEFDYAGLTPVASRIVRSPRVGEAHAALECRVTEVFRPRQLSGNPSSALVVIGEVVGVHIDEAMLVDGRFDATKAGNVSRLGYFDYGTVDEVLTRVRPRWEPR